MPLRRNGLEISDAAVEVCFAGLYDTVLSYYGSQYLGEWEKGVGTVLNKNFNEWRGLNNKGGDFWIYSDIKTIKRNPPDVLTILLP